MTKRTFLDAAFTSYYPLGVYGLGKGPLSVAARCTQMLHIVFIIRGKGLLLMILVSLIISPLYSRVLILTWRWGCIELVKNRVLLRFLWFWTSIGVILSLVWAAGEVMWFDLVRLFPFAMWWFRWVFLKACAFLSRVTVPLLWAVPHDWSVFLSARLC